MYTDTEHWRWRPLGDKLFLGSTENVKHQENETTEEIKAMIKIIRVVDNDFDLNDLLWLNAWWPKWS